MKPVRPFLPWLTALLLSACSLVPTPVGQSQRPANLSTQTASDSQSTPSATGAQGMNQKTVTFPDMVTKTALSDPEPSDLDELSALLASFQAEEAADFSTASEKNKDDKGHDSNAAYVLEFKSKKAKGKRQILMPETGEFKLTLTSGPRFELLDNDARDGEARVQMPASTLKTWVHLDESRNGGTLEVSDELYYVKDTLSKERNKHKRHPDARYNTWFKLGLRPLPVPGDWHSPDGQSFVLRFKAQQVQEFQLIWQKRRESAPFPPGVAEIGPEGGKIELPGVATLTVPDGALTQKTALSMRQVSSALTPYDLTYVSPVVKFEPDGLQFQKPARIKMKNTIENWRHHPTLIQFRLFKQLPKMINNENDIEEHFRNQEAPPFTQTLKEVEALPLNEIEFSLPHFSFGAKVTENFLLNSNLLFEHDHVWLFASEYAPIPFWSDKFSCFT